MRKTAKAPPYDRSIGELRADGRGMFGPSSSAAPATVVGLLVEVPVMLLVCSLCNRTRGWFPATQVCPPAS